MSITITARHAGLDSLVTLLQEQHARKIDVIAPASALYSDEGNLTLNGLDPVLMDDGVMDPNGLYVPTRVFIEGVAEKLTIPLTYTRRLHAERPDLFDANVNGWLHGRKAKVVQRSTPEIHEAYRAGLGPQFTERTVREAIPGDSRSFMVRTFRGDDGSGIARALLSDRFARIENIDVLMAALDGVRDAGVDIEIAGCDLSDRRMYVRIDAPEVAMLAPELLKGYRSPFSGESGDANPTVFAGFELSNSEVGNGAFSITPRITVQVCKNGMTVTKDAVRAVHVGGRLDEGVVRWSDDTQQKNIDLVKAKTRDAIATFLNVDYMRGIIEAATEKAHVEITDVPKTIEVVGKRLSYTQEQQAGILAHFIKGGLTTSGGVMHAVTAYAQTVEDPDTASELEASALSALDVAAATA